MLSLSVIIIHHRTPELLCRCVNSLSRGGIPIQDVIVVDVPYIQDNHSKLTSDRLGNSIRIVSLDTNRGFGFACNRGAEQVNGDVFVFLNADTELDNEALRPIADAFLKYEKIGAAGFRIREKFRNPAPSRLVYPHGPWRVAWNLIQHRCPRRERANAIVLPVAEKGIFQADWVLGAAIAVRRNVFSQIGGYDEKFMLFFEEIDLCRRIRKTGWEVVTVTDASIFHFHKASTDQYNQEEIETIRRRSQRYYYYKHYGLFGWIVASLDRSCLRWRI